MIKGGIGNMMKQVQQVQENMAKMQAKLAKLAEIEIEGQSGAGMVKVTMTCKYDVRRVTIDPSLMGDDREMLEDLVAAAVNGCGAQGRIDGAGKNGQRHRRPAESAGNEAAVLRRCLCSPPHWST